MSVRVILKPAFLVSIVILLGACSGLVSQKSGRHSISSSLHSFLYPDNRSRIEIKPEIPVLKLPIRVGLAFIPSQNWGGGDLDESTKYRLLNKVKGSFDQHQYIESISIIPSTYLRASHMKGGSGYDTLTQVARLHGVDVMALVSYDQLTQSRQNNASLLYWTIVGMYVIPGNENTVQTFVDTAVFDVRSRKMLMRAPGVSKLTQRSTAIGVDTVLTEKSYQGFNLAFDDMVHNLNQELTHFRQRAKEGRVATIEYRQGYAGGSFNYLLLLLLVFVWLRKESLNNWPFKKFLNKSSYS